MNDETMDEVASELDFGARMDALMGAEELAARAESEYLARLEQERIAAWCLSGLGHDDELVDYTGDRAVWHCKVCDRYEEVQ